MRWDSSGSGLSSRVWVSGAPLYHVVALESLSRRDIAELLDQAIARG